MQTAYLLGNWKEFLDKTMMRRIISPSSGIYCNIRQPIIISQHTLYFSSKATTTKSTTQQRSAKMVKNTDITNKYLDQVRAEVVDPALQLKTIEDELMGTIGKALGKQGEKVLFAIREMKQHHIQYTKHIENQSYDEAFQSAQMYNNARRKAIKVRWELLVHRQAVGFTVNNHSVVHETYNIGDQLPTRLEDIVDENVEPKQQHADESTKKKWGDQLSWWQRVGRWK